MVRASRLPEGRGASKACPPERGRKAADSKDPPKSESIPYSKLSGEFRGSFDCASLWDAPLGMAETPRNSTISKIVSHKNEYLNDDGVQSRAP